MNCKPGDLAVLIKGRHCGRLFHILNLAPRERFLLPDGWPNQSNSDRAPAWVCEVAGSPVEVWLTNGERRMSRFVVCQDYALRPIRDPGEDVVDEMLRPLPVKVAA